MIRCILIDPDAAARKVLSREISRDERFSIAGMYDSPDNVPFPINRNTVDVLFIEVALRGQNGLDFIRHMDHPPVTVITTAYRDYAVECFELDIADYLVKPIEADRLQKALLKIDRILTTREKHLPARRPVPHGQGDHLFIRADKKQIKLYYADILFVESIKDYICIHTVTSQYVIHQTLSGFTATLPPDRFLRIHRSYTISLAHIESLSGSTVHIADHNLPIGRNYLSDTRHRILGE